MAAEPRRHSTADFDYDLPPELVATEPPAQRDAARLMILRAGTDAPDHGTFADLPSLLRAGDVLVLNDTRVIPARLFGRREPSGGAAELLLLEPANDTDDWTWCCLARPGKKLRVGTRIQLRPAAEATVANDNDSPAGPGEPLATAEVIEARESGERMVRITPADAGTTFEALLERLGVPPLPPYILAARRQFQSDSAPARDGDRADYQTVYAREGRSVAAPTAGLHFTPELLDQLSALGVTVERVRLDVGAGTFKPVETDDPTEHPMHAERYWIDDDTAARINAARAEGRRIVAVGTTVVRALESAAQLSGNGTVVPGHRATNLLILPGHEWRIIDAIVTNFHLPRSTLIMLVAAMRDRESILAAYREAVARGYKFYSYGDAMFVERS